LAPVSTATVSADVSVIARSALGENGQKSTTQALAAEVDGRAAAGERVNHHIERLGVEVEQVVERNLELVVGVVRSGFAGFGKFAKIGKLIDPATRTVSRGWRRSSIA
jgi:hypothetical protein